MMNRRQALRALALSAAAVPAASLAWSQSVLPPATKPPAAPPLPSPGPAKPAEPAAGPFVLPPLGYGYDALEPHIDAQTMQIHHDKHHAAYVANLNKAVAAQPELGKKSVEELLRDLSAVPEAVRTAVKNQGGGHANHTLLWTSMRKGGATGPSGALAEAINKAFGGFPAFQEKLTAAAASVFGSGWAWLTVQGAQIAIETTPNQDSPISTGRTPLLGIDVWEHAYYLKYQNRRAEYLAAFLQVVDWDAVSARYTKAK